MDTIDRRIISILQENARTPLKVIAEKTYLSSPAVSARIDRLEKEGIITGYTAKVDMVKLGYLYAQRGAWEGQQLLSEKWIEEEGRPVEDKD